MSGAMTVDAATALAVGYARRGFAAGPVAIGWDARKQSTNKRPLPAHGFYGFTTDLDLLRRRFNGATLRPGEVWGVGLWLGPSGVVALDVDVKGGAGGDDSLHDLEREHGELPATVRVVTASGGGHVWLDKGAQHVGNVDFAPGIEVRADKGYVVAPGVTTPWGRWEFEDGYGLEDLAPAPAPAWVLKRLNGADGAPPPGSSWQRLTDEGRALLDRATVDALARMEANGWHSPVLRSAKERQPWVEVTRPGKTAGTSASIGYVGPGVVKVFTATACDGSLTTGVYEWDDAAGAFLTRQQASERDFAGISNGAIGATATVATTSSDDDFELDESLRPVDLGPVIDGTGQQPSPELLTRDDGRALLYAGALNGIHGDSGAGKGWIACRLICENAREGQRTVLIDLEDTADSIVARLRLLGLTGEQIRATLVYIRPQVALGPRAVEYLCRLTVAEGAAAVIVDSLGEAFALEGINEDKDVEVGPWFRRVLRPLTDTGAAVLVIDHATKAADNPLHPSGSKRKRAAITGASYLVEAVEPFVKGRGGRVRLTCAKDRHGNYRKGERVGDLVMSSDENIRLELYAPTTAAGDATVPTVLAARAAVTAARNARRPVSRNELEGLMAIKASASVKRGGIDHAVAEGDLIETPGGRNSRTYTAAEAPTTTSSHLVPTSSDELLTDRLVTSSSSSRPNGTKTRTKSETNSTDTPDTPPRPTRSTTDLKASA